MTSSEQRAMREQHGLVNKHTAPDEDIQSQHTPHFGNYDLVRRIDVGGMGEVYLARQRTAFGRQVAVKIIRSDLMHDVTTRKRFLREAEVSAHLKHDHILPLVEFGEEQGRLFLVTPYIEGGTLGRRLQRGPLPLPDVYQLFSALVRAVAYIHKRGVIHRDLKPSNILLEQDGEHGQTYVRLIDFGIASIQGAIVSAPLTSAGHEMGTVAYMAPERLSGIAAPSNDIYSLGIILYQMLTGQLPHNGKAVALPQALDAIVKRSTATDPNQRYTTAEDLLKAFEYAYRFLSANVAQKNHSGLIKAVTIEEDAPEDNEPTPKSLPLPLARSLASAQEFSESMILRRNEESNGQSKTTTEFKGADYSAPTSYIGPAKATTTNTAHIGTNAPARPRRKRKASLVVALTIATIAVLFALAGIGLLAFQAAISATVTIAPQTHTLTNVLTITARIGQNSIDVAHSTIPATILSSTKTTQNTGPTTGQNCVFIFDCQQVVDQTDVDNLTAQATTSLQNQITQDVRNKVQAGKLTSVGIVHYNDPTIVANPPVGTQSKTVTVTITQQGYLEAIKTSDVTDLARQALTQKKNQQYGEKYILLSQLTQIGQPAIQSVDGQGNVTIQIAIGGVVKYQLSSTDLNTLQTHIKGMKLKDARLFLGKQAGIDPTAIGVHLSYGDTLPTNIQQIKMVATDPTSIPTVQLPPVKPANP